MKLFPKLHTRSVLSTISALAIVTFFAAGSTAALADKRHNDRNNRGYNSGFNNSRDYTSNSNRSSASRFAIAARNDSNKYGRNSNFNRSYNRNDRSYYKSNNRFFNNSTFGNSNRYRNNSRGIFGNNYRRDNDDRWSINLHLGSGYTGSRYNSGFFNAPLYGSVFSASNSLYSPYSSRRNHTSVTINTPTVVYVNDSGRDAGHVTGRYSSSSRSRSESSLLRDTNGNCFERSYDSNGRENRIRLPDSACNF